MKRRVAFIATFAVLVVLAAYTAVCARVFLNNMTDAAADKLLRLCRASAEMADCATFFSDEEAMRRYAADIGVTMQVADERGVLLVDSRPALSVGGTLTADAEIKAAIHDGSATAVRPIGTRLTLFAAVRAPSGHLVRLMQNAPTMHDALGGVARTMGPLLIVSVLLCFAVVSWSLSGAYVTMDEILRVTAAFADGRFDERAHSTRRRQPDSMALFNATANRIEDQLRHQARRTQAFSAVINQMQNGILAVDDRLNVILVTPKAKTLLGIAGSPDGMPLSEVSKDVKLDTILLDAMRQDGVYTNEVAAKTAQGRSHRPIRLYVSPMRQDGATVGAVALVEDITELRRLEQVRTDFAANVSHELKTPLTSIKGFVETLQAGAIENPEMAQKFLRIIMLEADRLTRLINDILAISKLESGSDEVSNACISVDGMASDIVEMLSIHADEKKITLRMMPVSEKFFIWGNSDRVEQMLLNLVENGIKYNQPGGSVTVSVYGSSESVQILISDTGIGIPKEHLPRLFERFYRVDKGRSRSMGGTGLGLAIVKHIVKSMDGLIEVHSEFGSGTEFLITLPRYHPDPVSPDAAEGDEASRRDEDAV